MPPPGCTRIGSASQSRSEGGKASPLSSALRSQGGGVPFGGRAVAQQELEIIPLRSQTVDQVLPTLLPLVEPGGTLTVGQELDIPGFDPLKVGVYDTSANTAAAAIFDTLMTLDDKGEPKPKLALSWEHSEDFKTWTIKLRPGVKFHDGTPVTAKDVKWSLDRAVSVGGFPTFQMSAGSLTKPEQFVVVDDHNHRSRCLRSQDRREGSEGAAALRRGVRGVRRERGRFRHRRGHRARR